MNVQFPSDSTSFSSGSWGRLLTAGANDFLGLQPSGHLGAQWGQAAGSPACWCSSPIYSLPPAKYWIANA